MHILFLSHYFPPEGNAPASRTHETCKRWVRWGEEVSVITSFPNAPRGVLYPGYRNRLLHRERVDGIEVWRIWTYLAANRGVFRRSVNHLSFLITAMAVWDRLPRFDLVIATIPQFFCGVAGALLAWRKRVPFILEVRDLWPESIKALGIIEHAGILRGMERGERWICRYANHVVTIGDGLGEALALRAGSPSRISVVPNGIDPEVFAPGPGDPSLRKRLGGDGKFVCSYVGTVGMACGLDILSEASLRLRQMGRTDILFLVVGDGAIRAELERRLTREGASNVIFLGWQPKERIPGILAVSDACLVHLKPLRLFEAALPSKLFEAAGMARPILNGVAGESAQWIHKARVGVNFRPGDPEDLVRSLCWMADHPLLSRQMGQDGYRYVMEHHNRERLSARYLDIVRDAFRSASPTGCNSLSPSVHRGRWGLGA